MAFDLGHTIPNGGYHDRFSAWITELLERLEDSHPGFNEDRDGRVARLFSMHPWKWFDEGLSVYEAFLHHESEED